MGFQKKQLLKIAKKVQDNNKISPSEVDLFLHFEKNPNENIGILYLKRSAIPISLIFGFLFSIFPTQFEIIAKSLPSWTNLPSNILAGIDYLWDIIGEPVGKENIIYHLPNIIFYSFGVLGIKKLIEALDRKNWLDAVLNSQKLLKNRIENGIVNFGLKKGHSLLFVGKGDFIGMQFSLNNPEDNSITISETKPEYTTIWNYYKADTLFDDLKKVIERSGGENAGEYIFFPVRDDQIFLPSPISYDLSPHKLDILCQNIRTIEKEEKWKPRRIILVGDKFHKSFVFSEDQRKIIPKSQDTISLQTIARKYPKVTILDPTDIVMNEIILIARGRKIVFRATKQGMKEYKDRFYKRLIGMGYKQIRKKGILTIGYDIFEDQIEQQTLSRKINEYFPVVLSKNVHDALIRNGYKKSEFIYVPDLVINALSQKASEQ